MANHRIPLSRAPRSLYTLPTLIEAGAISAQPFQTRRPLERNYATRASGRPYAHELRGSRLKPRLPNLRERKPFSPLHSPHFDSIFHRNRAEETMAPFANSSTRRFEFRLDRLIAAPYYLRRFQPDCHVALQMFSNRQPCTSFDGPLFHAPCYLLLARRS